MTAQIEGAPLVRDVRVSYWKEYAPEVVCLDFAELAVPRFKDGDSDIHGIPSITDQRAFVMAEPKSRKLQAVAVERYTRSPERSSNQT